MKRWKIGTIDLPLASPTSFTLQSGRACPSNGEPPMSTNVGLTVGVEAGTVTPAGTPFRSSPTMDG